MADIELVIKIPEEVYYMIKKGYTMLGGRSSKTISSILFAAVVNGKLLPKGHGRLIDADNIAFSQFFDAGDYVQARRGIHESQTIIEADKK